MKNLKLFVGRIDEDEGGLSGRVLNQLINMA